MSESKEADEKEANGRKPLSLKRSVDTGHVQQKFSHGRSKSVVVEKKRKRTVAAPKGDNPRASGGRAGGAKKGNLKRTAGPGGLSQEEVAKRAAALAAAQRADKEAERKAKEAERAAAEAAIIKAKQEEADRKVAAELERKKAEEAAVIQQKVDKVKAAKQSDVKTAQEVIPEVRSKEQPKPKLEKENRAAHQELSLIHI